MPMDLHFLHLFKIFKGELLNLKFENEIIKNT